MPLTTIPYFSVFPCYGDVSTYNIALPQLYLKVAQRSKVAIKGETLDHRLFLQRKYTFHTTVFGAKIYLILLNLIYETPSKY